MTIACFVLKHKFMVNIVCEGVPVSIEDCWVDAKEETK